MAQLSASRLRAMRARGHQYDVSVGGIAGLVLRVHESGTKTFRLRYSIHGKRRWISLGEFPTLSLAAARREARRLAGAVAEGRDPSLERRAARIEQRQAGSVAEMVARYIDEYAHPRKRTWSEDQRVLERDLVKRYGTLPARELTKQHVLEILNDARKRGMDGGLRNLLAIIRKLGNWAVAVDILTDNPASGVQRPVPPRARERVLSRTELGAYWNLLHAPNIPIDDRTRAILRIQCLTGLRIGEVAGARWIETQLADRKWHIPAERMKAGRAHAVPLTDHVASLFEQAQRLDGQPSVYVFPSDTTEDAIRSASVTRAVKRLQPRCGFGEHFTTHDVRRTCATALIEDGFPPEVVDRLLAHVPTSVLGRHYNLHSYQREKLEALEHWGEVVLDAAAKQAVAQ